MSTFDKREFWEKFEEEGKLKEKLSREFEVYSFIIDIKGFISTLNFLHKEVEDLKNEIVDQGDVKKILKISTKASVLYFSAFSTQLSFESYFYLKTGMLKGATQKTNHEGELKPYHEKFHPLIDQWKKSDSIKIVKAIRNRFQHGALLRGTLTYSFRTKWHKDGEGNEIVMDDSTIWDNLGNSPAEQKKLSKYCEELFCKSSDKLFALLEDYKNKTSDLQVKLEEQFNEIYKDEVATRNELIGKLIELDKWFQQNGLWSPWPSIPMET